MIVLWARASVSAPVSAPGTRQFFLPIPIALAGAFTLDLILSMVHGPSSRKQAEGFPTVEGIAEGLGQIALCGCQELFGSDQVKKSTFGRLNLLTCRVTDVRPGWPLISRSRHRVCRTGRAPRRAISILVRMPRKSSEAPRAHRCAQQEASRNEANHHGPGA